MIAQTPFFFVLILYGLGAFQQCSALASPSPGPILVVGASGGTGLRALQGLLNAGYAPSNIRVLSRNVEKPLMVELRDCMGFSTVQADLDCKDDNDLSRLETALRGCVGIYIHSTSSDTKKLDTGEEDRAKNLVKAIARSNSDIRHVVYNSAAAETGHGVVRIAQKHAVERLFESEECPDTVRFTSLRAFLFMEELWKDYTRPGILKGKFSFSVPSDRKLYLTSVKDMGHVAGTCLLSPWLEKNGRCRKLNIAGDVLSVAEMSTAFAKAQGSSCVHSKNRFLEIFARLFFRDLYQQMKFFKTTTEKTNIDELKKQFPGALSSFETFLEETQWGNPELSYEDLSRRSIVVGKI